MSNGLCACGLPLQAKHTHRLSSGPGGLTCQDCGEIVVEPILTTSDPRNESAAKPAKKNYVVYPPLPVLLIDLWDDGRAPVAPYVEEIGAYSHPHDYEEWLSIFSPWKQDQIEVA